MIIKIDDRIKLVFIVLVTVLFCFIFGIFGKSLFKLNKITILILISLSIISCIIWCIKVYRRKKGIIKGIEKIDILGRTLQFKNGVCLVNNQIVMEVEMKDALDSFNKFFTSKNINDTIKEYYSEYLNCRYEIFKEEHTKKLMFEFKKMEPRTICLLKNVTLLFLLEKVPLSIVIAVRKNEKKKLIITRIKKNEDINISYEFTD